MIQFNNPHQIDGDYYHENKKWITNMKKHKTNFHSHTYLCGHALGTPLDYVKEAIKNEYQFIGISEHAPMPNISDVNIRLKFTDYQKYLNLLDKAIDFGENNNLKVYKGFEIEYFDDLDIYEKYLKDVDYLILGQHFIVKDGKLKSTYHLDSIEDIQIYTDTLLRALDTGYFSILCHPDLCFINIDNPTDKMYDMFRKVILKAIELNIPIEINAGGIRRAKAAGYFDYFDKYKYPSVKLFKIVKELEGKVIISSDAHNISHLNDESIEKAYEFADALNLNIVDDIKMK